MRFDPTKTGKKKVVEKYPTLARFGTLTQRIPGFDTDKLVRFALLLCDWDSPVNDISNEKDRRLEAAKLAGLDITKTNILNLLELDGSTSTAQKVDDIFHTIFVLLNNTPYELWFTTRQNYYQISKVLRTNITEGVEKDIAAVADKRVRINKNLKEVAQELLNMHSSLFPNSTAKKIIERTSALQMINWPEINAEEDTVE